MAIWSLIAGDDEVHYKSQAPSKKNCWQTCTASAILYQATDGVAPDLVMEERNLSYLYTMKEQLEFKILSGWRTWKTRSSSSIDDGYDAPPFITKFAPWEPAVDPVLLEDIEDEDDESGEEE